MEVQIAAAGSVEASNHQNLHRSTGVPAMRPPCTSCIRVADGSRAVKSCSIERVPRAEFGLRQTLAGFSAKQRV
jgi:hypothetical protein